MTYRLSLVKPLTLEDCLSSTLTSIQTSQRAHQTLNIYEVAQQFLFLVQPDQDNPTSDTGTRKIFMINGIL